MGKARRGGYDGKGTFVINNFDNLQSLLTSVDTNQWMIETWVSYEKELALVASRDLLGRVRTLPLVETYQHQQVCDWVIAPANIDNEVEIMAYNIACSVLNELNYFGVIGIEFFYGKEGLLVNEIAPRTHNSAHFSIEACSSSQFDQQICIASNLPVPETELIVPGAIMVNLLGLEKGSTAPINERLEKLRSCKDVYLHWYEKEIEVPGRKLGHATVLLNSCDPFARNVEAVDAMKRIRDIWPIV